MNPPHTLTPTSPTGAEMEKALLESDIRERRLKQELAPLQTELGRLEVLFVRRHAACVVQIRQLWGELDRSLRLSRQNSADSRHYS